MVAICFLIHLWLAHSLTVEQVHVATGQKPGDITVSWSTRSSCSSPSLHINSKTYVGSTLEYSQGTNVQWISKTAASLAPATTYSYQVSCGSQLSSSFTLKTPPSSGETIFIIYGDLTVSEDKGQRTLESIKDAAQRFDLSHIIHVGDIAYDLFTNDWRQGDDFMNQVQSLTSRLPFMTVPGNHEADDGYASYDARFAMPQNNFYYTYTVGLIKYVAINTEAYFYPGTDIQKMLSATKDALARSADERKLYPWLIVYGHRPLYCIVSGKKCNSEAQTLRSAFEDMFYKAEVDLYINGHVHNYERTSALYNSKVITSPNEEKYGPLFDYIKPSAPIYITTGGAGADGGNDDLDEKGAPDWYIYGSDAYTYSVVSVFNSTHLLWEQWKAKDGTITDNFWIKK